MASAGEGSRIPSAVSGKDKRRSFLPGPKTLSSKPSSSTGAEKPQARPSFRVGEQVVISGVKRGRLRYLGPAHFAEGEWCGIELDEPDGNHDGVVEGKRYFACIPNHGIFAPSQKVELVKSAQNGTSDSGIKREASPASTGSRLKQPKTSGLVQPQTRTRSKSPEVSRKSPESKEASKFQSKLVRPKSIPKPRTVSVGVLSSSSDTDTEKSGYQPDGDDIVEISPETDEAPVAPPLEQDTTVQENTVQDSALQDTAVQNTTVQNDTVQETTVQENSVQDSALQGGTMEESALQETVLHREEAQSTEQPGKDTEVKETQVSAQPDTGKTRDTGKNRDLAETRDETEVRVEAETRDMAGTRDAVETRDMAETTPAESRSEPQVGETVMVNHIQSLDEDLSSDTSSHQRADDSLGESSNEDITVCEFREKSSSTEVDTESPKEETKRTEMEKEQTDEPHSPQEEQAPPLLHEESVVEEEVEEERVEPVESMQVLAEPVPVLEMKEIDVRPQEDFVAVQEQKEHAPSAEKFDIIQKEKEDEMSSSTRKDAGNEKEEKLAEEEIKEKTNESVENDKEEPIKVDPNIQEEKVNEIMQKREEEGEMSSSTMKDAGSEKCKSAEEFKESEVGVHTIEVHGEMSDEMRKLGECSMMENYIVPVERLPMVETEEKDLPGDHGVERKVEMMTMVEVAVVDEAMTDSDMSESTVKDLGFGEIGLKDIEEEPETPTHVEELEKDEKKEEETEVDQLEKEKDKKVKEKTVQKDVKGLKSKGVNNKSNTEKIDKTPLKGKQIKAKTVGKKDSPDKIDTKKPNTKVTSKVGSLINKPNTAKGKDLDNSKLSKNAANKKKSDLGINAKNTTITVGVVTARQRRASAPAPKIDLNASARSVGARSVISDISEDTSKTTKSLKREKPKSKWDNIMNKIETSKKDPKPKPDVKSKIGDQRRASLNPSALPSQQNRTPISTRKTSVVDTNKKSTLRPASAAKSMRPGTAPSPEASRPGSRVSSASDVSARSTRPTSAKPQNRTTGALRKERSPSAGSESATSVISVCSSQGSKPSQSSKSARTSPRESTPERLKAASRMGKRNSTTAIEKPATKSTLAEKRRASVATSRLAPKTSKDSVDGQKSSTLKKPLGKDANRSKTATRGTPSSASKRNPPDVVATSATGKAAAAAEISRLEALCEARTKELNYTKLQLKSRLQGFEAMTVLVKYLTEELNAFSCPEVTEKLIKCQEDLAKAQTQLGELEKAKDVLEVEIGKMKEEHTQEVLDLKTEHAMKVTSAEERLKREAQKEAQRVIDKHYHEIKTLKAFHEKHIVELKTDHERELLMKQEDQLEEISRLQSQQEERLVELQHQHQMKLEEITMRFDHIKVSLHEKVEFLRKEGEEMRMREQHYIQQCQLDSDMKVQRAIAPFQHLPAEIESLKAVMEMRNQEIHDLRRQKVDMEKELDELPPARDRILNLQQKVENLEAIIDIKAEYERQLAEKHTLLLRKFDRESKANKRLSMEAEELTWRLTQQEAQVLGMGGSPDLVRRQISRSPPTTPDPLRRKKSPTARSPTAKSPRHSTSSGSTSSSGDFMTMSNTSLMSNSGSDFLTPLTPNGPSVGENSKTVPLRRSGTYDLLQKDCENETELKKANDQLMKQSDV